MCSAVCIIINFLLILNFVYNNLAVSYCDEEHCGSIVSNCILTQSCTCEQRDHSCYKNCLQCMGRKYFEDCCSCLDLCPKADDSKTSLLHKSHVEEFEGIPELFNSFFSLSAEELADTWNVQKFTMNNKINLPNSNLNISKVNSDELGNINLTVNCTVVYFDYCTSWNQCRQTCRKTGASSYRWFYDGCCECVGSTCVNYGVNESRCKFCPEEYDDEEFEEDFG